MKNKHSFFFNHKGIKGHASFVGKPSKKTVDALFAMVEIASKTVGKSKPKSNEHKN